MRRNVVFEKGRRWRVDDDQVQDLRLEPGRGAAIGEYMYPESSEYSDSYYGPGRQLRADRPSGPPVGGVTRHPPHARSMNDISANRFSSGELRPGARSWADLGVSSVHPGEAGITERREGPHRGIGPKGYRRSDERTKEVICERLTDDPYVDARDIDVEVTNGEVTLTGSVSDRRAKWRAEDLVEACTGGAEVHNRLRVSRQ